jgi:hypothetical protein
MKDNGSEPAKAKAKLIIFYQEKCIVQLHAPMDKKKKKL